VFDRFSRSWDLASACMQLLSRDKTLLLFPAMSFAAMVLIIGSFAVPLIPVLGTEWAHGMRGTSMLTYFALFLFYWLQYTIVIFFNTGLVEVALRRFDDQDATIGDGLRRAWSRLPIIVAYALIAATVGMALRLIAERVGLLGKIVIALLGFAWTVATALVTPVLAAEDVGPVEAVKRSAELIRKAWGEDIIGNAGIGLVFGVLQVAVMLVGGILIVMAIASHSLATVVSLGMIVVLAVSAVALAQATLHGIYSAALYRFADGDPAAGGIDPSLLKDAFGPRK
jgi:hypothetical protein